MKFGLSAWGFIVGAAGLITLVASIIQMIQVRSFADCSQSVTGKITGKYVHHGLRARIRFSLDVEYEVEGVTYKRSVPASLDEYNTLVIGEPFKLMYKPDNPRKIIRADNLEKRSIKAIRILALISAASTVAGVVLFYIDRM